MLEARAEGAVVQFADEGRDGRLRAPLLAQGVLRVSAIRIGRTNDPAGQSQFQKWVKIPKPQALDARRLMLILVNMAVSRAQSLAVLVASPELLEIRCRTIEQMRMVNALCRFVEKAM